MAKNLLNYNLSEPLSGAAAASVDIHAGYGNLTIDSLPDGDLLLASGTLQYLQNQDAPACTRADSPGQAVLSLRAGKGSKPRFQFPWSGCTGATAWLVHLNSGVSYDLRAGCNGGNIRLDLADMTLTTLQAESSGGNLEVILPAQASGLNATLGTGGGNVSVEIGSGYQGSNQLSATTGAGKITVLIPAGTAARILSTSGMGKVVVDPLFPASGDHTYQSPDFEQAVDRIEISAKSGAGNVSIQTR